MMMMMISWPSFVVSHSLLVGHLGCLNFLFFIFKEVALWGFLGSPVVKTPCFQCRGHRFSPGSGDGDPACHVVKPKNKKKVRSSYGYDRVKADQASVLTVCVSAQRAIIRSQKLNCV